MTLAEIKKLESEGYMTKSQILYYKLWACLRIAMLDEGELGCHCNDIVKHLGKSVESQFTYYDTLMDVWCNYFLEKNERPAGSL